MKITYVVNVENNCKMQQDGCILDDNTAVKNYVKTFI